MVTSYLHMMHSYAAYKTRLSINIYITYDAHTARVSRRDYDSLVYVPKCAHYQYILRNNLSNCHAVYRRCASDERKAHECLTRSLHRKIIFNVRIADITFLCNTIRVFGIDTSVEVLVSLFCLFVCF